MKVLLSAYACDPTRGSECAVGWNWATKLADQGYEVWVITHSSSRAAIDNHLRVHCTQHLHFHYHRVRWLPKAIVETQPGYYLQYVIWQWGAYQLAKVLHARIGFSRAQHVTFVSVRLPSFIGLLGVPFIFGPVGGGEYVSWPLVRGFPIWRWPREIVRKLSNHLVRFDPLLRWTTFSRAERIIVTSPDTLKLVPRTYQPRCDVHLAIGTDTRLSGKDGPLHSSGGNVKILYAGALLYWKGIHLALRAFAKLHQLRPDSLFTIVGSGPDSAWLHKLADSLRVGDAVEWIPWMDHRQLLDFYREFDLVLFPSTRDSGGLVVLEAMANGLPVICLDRGGPAAVVNEHCGRIISTNGSSEADIVHRLFEALYELTGRAGLLEMRQAAIVRAAEFRWERLVEQSYPRVEQLEPARQDSRC